jgi:hypothetical protein
MKEGDEARKEMAFDREIELLRASMRVMLSLCNQLTFSNE